MPLCIAHVLQTDGKVGRISSEVHVACQSFSLYILTCTYIHTNTHTYIHAYIHTCERTSTVPGRHTYIRTYWQFNFEAKFYTHASHTCQCTRMLSSQRPFASSHCLAKQGLCLGSIGLTTRPACSQTPVYSDAQLPASFFLLPLYHEASATPWQVSPGSSKRRTSR